MPLLLAPIKSFLANIIGLNMVPRAFHMKPVLSCSKLSKVFTKKSAVPMTNHHHPRLPSLINSPHCNTLWIFIIPIMTAAPLMTEIALYLHKERISAADRHEIFLKLLEEYWKKLQEAYSQLGRNDNSNGSTSCQKFQRAHSKNSSKAHHPNHPTTVTQ